MTDVEADKARVAAASDNLLLLKAAIIMKRERKSHVSPRQVGSSYRIMVFVNNETRFNGAKAASAICHEVNNIS